MRRFSISTSLAVVSVLVLASPSYESELFSAAKTGVQSSRIAASSAARNLRIGSPFGGKLHLLGRGYAEQGESSLKHGARCTDEREP